MNDQRRITREYDMRVLRELNLIRHMGQSQRSLLQNTKPEREYNQMNDLQMLDSVNKRGLFTGPVASLGSVIENMVRDLTEQTFECPDYTGTKVYTSKRATDMEQS